MFPFGWMREIDRKLSLILANQEKIMSDQDILNQDAAAFTTALNTIAAEISALQQQASNNQPLDFSALNAALSQAQQIANPPAPPAAPAQ